MMQESSILLPCCSSERIKCQERLIAQHHTCSVRGDSCQREHDRNLMHAYATEDLSFGSVSLSHQAVLQVQLRISYNQLVS